MDGFIRIEETKELKKRCVSILLLIFLTTGSMIWVLREFLYTEIAVWETLLPVVILTPLIWFASCRGRTLCFTIIGCVLLMGIFFVIFQNSLFSGVVDCANRFLYRFNYISGEAIDYFVIPNEEYVSFGSKAFFALLSAGCVLYVAMMIIRKHAIGLLFCWIPIILASVFFEIYPGIIVISCSAVSVLGVFACNRVKNGKDGSYAVAILILTCILIGGGICYTNMVEYRPSERVNEIRQNLVDQVETIRFGTSDFPQGKTTEAVSSEDTLRFRVSLSERAKLYFRGYVGSTYEKEAWSELEGKKYSGRYEGMIRGYEQEKFHPLSEVSCYQNVAERIPSAGVSGKKIKVEVQNVNAFRKYILFPNGITFDSLQTLGATNQDVNLYANDSRVAGDRYSMDVFYTEPDTLLGFGGNGWLEETEDYSEQSARFRAAEVDYRHFVEQQYLTQDEKDIESIGTPDFSETDGLPEIAEKIREHLKVRGKSKGWDSVQYATNGTLLFRAANIPARYVEGYIVDGSRAEKRMDESHQKNYYQLDVLAKNAHAWVEIYKEGLGWLPVIVTPGYYDELPSSSEASQSQASTASSSQNQNQKDTEKEENNADNATGYVTFSLVKLLLLVGIILLLVLLIGFLTLCIRRTLYIRKRKDEVASSDLLVSLRAMSAHLADIYRFSEMREEQLDVMIKEILMKWRFSVNPSDKLTGADISQVSSYIETIIGNMKTDASLWRHFRMKYFACLF